MLPMSSWQLVGENTPAYCLFWLLVAYGDQQPEYISHLNRLLEVLVSRIVNRGSRFPEGNVTHDPSVLGRSGMTERSFRTAARRPTITRWLPSDRPQALPGHSQEARHHAL